MDNVITSPPEPSTEAEYEAALDPMLQELRRHEEWMNRDRQDIERLKAETQVIASHTDSVLANIRKQLDSLQKGGSRSSSSVH
jgi:hypothetical protein